jgi:neutral ceramidase
MNWIIGLGRSDITAFIPGIVMLGYGNHRNTVKYVHKSLNARCVWIDSNEDNRSLVFVNFEICHVSQSVTDRVIEEFQKEFSHLNIPYENIILTAQHTHAAPGGYTHYALYNLPTPGYCPEVLEVIVSGAIKAIKMAYEKRAEGDMVYKAGFVPLDADICFNRSVEAYNSNPEVIDKLNKNEEHKALDREMRLFEFHNQEGQIGSMNWFAVHPTNIIWNNNYISPGSKGYASNYLEDHFNKSGKNDYLGIFNQGCCGDVSPIKSPGWFAQFRRKNDKRQLKKSMKNGFVQYTQALRIIEKSEGQKLSGGIDCELIYVDMSAVTVHPKFLPRDMRDEEVTTTPACLGVAFLQGAEHAGVIEPVAWITKLVTVLVKIYEFIYYILSKPFRKFNILNKYKMQGSKHIVIESGNKRILGTGTVKNFILPNNMDRMIGYLKKLDKEGGVSENTWTQQILPLQISIIGQVALVTLPAEPTTMSGKRIKKTILEILSKRGVDEVVVCPYSNGYSGYITTPEEYEHQRYEGGHTVFGKWTLCAYLTKLSEIATEMLKDKKLRKLDKSLRPPQFSEGELSKREYDTSKISA